MMTHPIHEVIIGNVIGVVEEPTIIDQSRPMADQFMVKIGVVGPDVPLCRRDACRVIERLRAFVVANILSSDDRTNSSG